MKENKTRRLLLIAAACIWYLLTNDSLFVLVVGLLILGLLIVRV